MVENLFLQNQRLGSQSGGGILHVTGKSRCQKTIAKVKYDAAKAASEQALVAAIAAEKMAEAQKFQSAALNAKAKKAIQDWRNAHLKTSKAKSKMDAAKPYNRVGWLMFLGFSFAVFFGVGMKIMGNSFKDFMIAFTFIFGISVLTHLAASQATMKHYGIGYAAWAIFFGMLISNTVGTPKWAMPAVQTEFYIKTGLVLLGAKILFEKIITIGTAGIFVAWVVTPIVWLVTYWVGQKIIKIPSKRLNATICSDMSVCGVSAAIATASACKAKKEELTLAVGLSLVFTSIMMIVMPAVIHAFFPADKVEIWAAPGWAAPSTPQVPWRQQVRFRRKSPERGRHHQNDSKRAHRCDGILCGCLFHHQSGS